MTGRGLGRLSRRHRVSRRRQDHPDQPPFARARARRRAGDRQRMGRNRARPSALRAADRRRHPDQQRLRLLRAPRRSRRDIARRPRAPEIGRGACFLPHRARDDRARRAGADPARALRRLGAVVAPRARRRDDPYRRGERAVDPARARRKRRVRSRSPTGWWSPRATFCRSPSAPRASPSSTPRCGTSTRPRRSSTAPRRNSDRRSFWPTLPSPASGRSEERPSLDGLCGRRWPRSGRMRVCGRRACPGRRPGGGRRQPAG